MPITVRANTRRIEEDEFRSIAYDAMRTVFDIHNEFGRFFDERIYKQVFGQRFPAAALEVPVEVTFESFRKLYFLDALLGGGAILEFKSVELLTGDIALSFFTICCLRTFQEASSSTFEPR